jgi:cysteine-rich repeat protein
MPAVCGDGAIAGAEACDDGNTAGGDGCSPACTIEAGFDCNGEPSVCVEPSCDGVQSWSGPTMSFPACFAYVIDQNHDANNCEFFVDVFGRGSFSVNGASGKWLEADLRMGAPEGDLQAVGMLTSYLDESNTQQTAWSLGAETGPGVWHTGFTWERTGLGPNNFSFTVVDFAFFIDVKNMAGDTVRLWISNNGANYTVAQTYAVPGQIESMGATTVEYAAVQASLFDQKHACMP